MFIAIFTVLRPVTKVSASLGSLNVTFWNLYTTNRASLRQISTGNNIHVSLNKFLCLNPVDHINGSFCHQKNYDQFGSQTGGVLEGNPPQEKHESSKQHPSGRYEVSTFCHGAFSFVFIFLVV